MNPKELLDTVLEIIDQVPKRFSRNRDGISRADKITQDLLHEIEFGNHDAPQRMALIKRLKANLQERRAMKKDNEALQPVFKALETGAAQNLKLDLYKVRKEVGAIIQTQETREYIPKVLTDLTIGGTTHDPENKEIL